MKKLTDYNPGVPKETNFEHYKREILEIVSEGNALALSNGVPIRCCDVGCHDCDLSETPCACEIILWGFQEYKEPIYLTNPEYHFLAAMETGYIGRDNHGHLFWFENPPSKVDGVWMNELGDTVRLSFMKTLKLPFVKYEGTCWSVEQLLTLEVKE